MFVRFVAIALLTCGLIGCTSPPERERHQAEGAIAAARAAGAAVYAPDALASAEHALSQYDAAVAEHDYRQALRLAIEARDGAYTAARLAADQRADVRSAAERLAADVERLLGEVESQLRSLPGSRSQSATAQRLRDLRDSGSSQLQEARSALAANEFRSVVEQLEPVLHELRSELEALKPSRPSR